MATTQLASILALRRLAGSIHASVAASLIAHPDSLEALRFGSRNAWLALEIALAGPALWDHLGNSLGPSLGNVFRQQMESLLDLLNIAGLECDHPEGLRRCRDELRSARQANFFEVADLRAWESLSSQDAREVEQDALGQIVQDLQKENYANLACLLGLQTLGHESLLLDILEYFLRRAFRNQPEIGDLLQNPPVDHSGLCRRSLTLVADLLEEHVDALVELLDGPEEAAGSQVESKDNAVEKLFQLGLDRFQNGDYRQATVHFTAGLKLDPANAMLFTHRGEAYRFLGEYERAITDFHAALHLKPAVPSVLISRAMAYQQVGESEQAIADCTAALELVPSQTNALRTRSAAYADLKEYDLALTDLTACLTLVPEDAGVLFQRGNIYFEKRACAQAIVDFNLVLERNPQNVQAFFRRGQAHFQQRDYVQAVSDFTEVLNRNPHHVAALGSRGRILQLQGEIAQALDDYTEALRLEPENSSLWCRRGILYRIQGNLEQAQADLDEAVRLQPQNSAALYHRGKIALAQGQFSLALLDLTEVLQHCPKLAPAFLSRALAYDRLGQFAAAREDCTQALKFAPRLAVAHLVRGVIHGHMGEQDMAIGDFTTAIELDENFALAFHERSLVYTLRSEYERALTDCNRLIALEPRNPRAYAHRSIVFHFQGDVQQALADYFRALQIDPHCLMSAWNPDLGENVFNRTTQRIADYIDGLRPEPATAGNPPPVDFSIVFESSPTQVDRAESRRNEETVLSMKAGDETIVAGPLPEPVVPATNRPVPTNQAKVTRSPKIRQQARTTPGPSQVPQPEPASPLGGELAKNVQTATVVAEKATIEVVPEVTLAVEPAKTSDPQQENVIPGPSPEPEEKTEPIQAQEPKIQSAQEFPAWLKVVECPICRRQTVPSEALAGGRLRCGECHAVFSPVLSQPPRTVPRKPNKKIADDDEETRLLAKFRKPKFLVGGAVVSLFLGYLFFAHHWFGKTNRLPVYVAKGEILFEGKPIPDASIFLHPLGKNEPDFPRPRAIAGENGSFYLGTFGKTDGAPAGEYKVTVQCFTKPAPTENDDAPPPRNLLPPKYARAETSDLTVKIQKGENKLPPLQLKSGR